MLTLPTTFQEVLIQDLMANEMAHFLTATLQPYHSVRFRTV